MLFTLLHKIYRLYVSLSRTIGQIHRAIQTERVTKFSLQFVHFVIVFHLFDCQHFVSFCSCLVAICI